MAALCLYGLIGFFIAPRVVVWYAPKFLKDQLQCQLDIGKVRINPFLLTFEVSNVSFSTQKEPIGAFKRLYIDFEITRMGSGAATFQELRLEKPTVHVTVYPDGSINLEKYIPKPPAESSSGSTPLRMTIQNAQISGATIVATDKRQSRPAILNILELDLNASNVSTLANLRGTYSISARTSEGGSFQCQGNIALEPFASSGKLSLSAIRASTLWQFMKDSFDLESVAGTLNMTTDYRLEFGTTPLQLQLDGLLFGILDLSLKLSGEDNAFLEIKKLDLNQTRFNLSEKKLLIGKLLVAGGALNLRIDEAGRINIAKIARIDPERNTADARPLEPTAKAARLPLSPPWTVDADSIEIKDIAFDFNNFSRATPVGTGVSSVGISFAAKIQASSQETKVLLENFSSELTEAHIQLLEATQPIFQTDKLTIEGGMLDLEAHVLNVSRIAMHGGTIDVSRDSKGQINWQQFFAPKQSSADISVSAAVKELQPSWNYRIMDFEVDGFNSNLSDLGIVPDEPILNIQSFSCRLTEIDGKSPMNFEADFSLKQGGTVAVSGKVDPAAASVEADVNLRAMSLTPLQPYLEPFSKVSLQSADVSLHGDLKYGLETAGAKIVYTGNASLDKLQLNDPSVNKTIIGWESIQAPQVKLTLQPNSLNIEEILLSKPTGEVIINQDQTLNLSSVLKSKDSQTITPASPKSDSKLDHEAFPVRIGKIDIEKGDMLFADLSLQPQFMTRINDLKGRISGLSSAGDLPSTVQLDGRVDQYGLAKISGKINVFNPGLSTDVSLLFKNVEMTKLTPYSGRFAGRRITSGKLSMDLKYRIQDHKLLGDNQIIVDNLTLGERLESPDAVNLPLDLAIALLQDSNGRIDIGLPVSGDLNDPQFSYGHLVWKTILNFLTKIVTSPFQALGAVFGGEGEQQDIVVFDPGKSELLPPEKEKLHEMGYLLKNRPQLRLNVQGRFSPDADGAEIKAQSLRLAIVGRTGSKSGEKEVFGALDFTVPNTQGALEKLFIEKAGAPALDALKLSIGKGAKNKADIPQVLAEALYSWLLENEPLSSEALLMLAENRAIEIVKELSTIGGIPSERLSLKTPEPQTSGSPSAKFSLDAQTASQ